MEKTKADMIDRLSLYKGNFDAAFKDVVNELVQPYENNEDLKEAASVLREALDYNTFNGKKSRGMMVIGTLDFLKRGKLTDTEIKNAYRLGWCVEILQAVFLIADDIMDRSDMRRGKPCWYKKVGLRAINDTYLMEQCIYYLIDKYFAEESYYVDLFKSFRQITFLTAMGQQLDMLASEPVGGFNLDEFTETKYKSIVKYKTAFYSFYLPVSLGMLIAQVKEKHMFKEAERVLLKLGEFFQIQDDYLDCYGDPAVIGKIGRDIEDAKCSWLVVQALKRVSDEDREILKENYGKDDPECVAVVKALYKKLDLVNVYKEFENQSYNELLELINIPENGFPKDLFIFLTKKIYKRQK